MSALGLCKNKPVKSGMDGGKAQRFTAELFATDRFRARRSHCIQFCTIGDPTRFYWIVLAWGSHRWSWLDKMVVKQNQRTGGVSSGFEGCYSSKRRYVGERVTE